MNTDPRDERNDARRQQTADTTFGGSRPVAVPRKPLREKVAAAE